MVIYTAEKKLGSIFYYYEITLHHMEHRRNERRIQARAYRNRREREKRERREKPEAPIRKKIVHLCIQRKILYVQESKQRVIIDQGLTYDFIYISFR